MCSNIECTLNTLVKYDFVSHNRKNNNELLCVKKNKHGEFLSTVRTQDVNIWNRILSVFGFGPLANTNLEIKKVALHLKSTLNAEDNLGLTRKVSKIISDREDRIGQTRKDSQKLITKTIEEIASRALEKGVRFPENFANNLFKSWDLDKDEAQQPMNNSNAQAKDNAHQPMNNSNAQAKDNAQQPINNSNAQVDFSAKPFDAKQLFSPSNLHSNATPSNETPLFNFSINNPYQPFSFNLSKPVASEPYSLSFNLPQSNPQTNPYSQTSFHNLRNNQPAPDVSQLQAEENFRKYLEKFEQLKNITITYQKQKEFGDLNQVNPILICADCFKILSEIVELDNQIENYNKEFSNNPTSNKKLIRKNIEGWGAPIICLRFAKLIADVYQDKSVPPKQFLNLDNSNSLDPRVMTKKFWETVLEGKARRANQAV